MQLFEFNRGRRLARAVVEDSVDALDLVDDTGRNTSDQAPRKLGKLCRHEVGRGDGADDAGIIVGSLITHAANGTHVGESGKVLVRISVETCLRHLLTEDRIGILNKAYLLGSHFADDTDRQTRTRERLTENKILRDTQFETGLSYFVLEQETQRFNDLFKIDTVRKSAYVVVGLDDRALTKTGFDNVRIDRTLYEEVYGTDLLGLFFKYTDEFFTDDLSLLLRLFALISG